MSSRHSSLCACIDRCRGVLVERALAALILTTSMACEGGPKPETVALGRDASTTPDDDAYPVDASADGSDDRSPSDAGVDAGPIHRITCESDELTIETARGDTGRAFAVAVHGNDVHLAYLVATCGGTPTNNVAQGIAYATFATTGEPSAAKDVVNSAPPHDCQKTRHPALAVHDDGVAELFYVSNAPGSYELSLQTLGVSATPVQQTNDSDNEAHLAAASLSPADDVMVAYANEPPSLASEPVQIVTAQPGKAESVVAPASAGHHVADLALSAIGRNEGQPMGAVAWVSDREETWGIHYRAIDETGAGVGDIVALADDIGGASNVDLAAQADGAAVVYTVSPAGAFGELRFRAIDADGGVGAEVKLTAGDQNVRDVSIAAYGDGYVIAYRRVGGAGGNEPSMRVLFVDAQGNEAGDRLVSAASAGATGSDVLVARDGRIVVIWGDVSASDGVGEPHPVVRVARLTCF